MLGKLRQEPTYEEEYFGILTDDDLYLDCLLVKPRHLRDEALRMLRVWVPRYPLTKTSVIACARQEVQSYGPDGNIAHLVFDLRGTGESEGTGQDFHIDLQSIRAWAEERFGTAINFGFLGSPELTGSGRVNLLPLRAGVIMETYYYPTSAPHAPMLLYLSTYGNFDRLDDARCVALAAEGYDVYGLDPLRYLLHASAEAPLTPSQLGEDLEIVCDFIGGNPYLIAQPIAAGLGILWGALSPKISGVTAIGRTQLAFQAEHIFDLRQPHTYDLTRHIGRIAPRPVALVWQQGHALGGDKAELTALAKATTEPRRLERTTDVSPQFLRDLLTWQQNINPS